MRLEPINRREVLHAILRPHLSTLQGDADDADDGEIMPLSGGYILEYAGEVIPPGCCGDLSHLTHWQDALSATRDWQMLWIGHPWTCVRRVGDVIHLSAPAEVNPSAALREAIAIPLECLTRAVASAHAQCQAFIEHLTDALASLASAIPSTHSPSSLACALAGT